MYNTDIKFIYTQADLFKKIQEYSENAKTIQFYCTNFESYYRNRITGLFEDQLLKHLLSLAQRINIEVFSYNSLDVENIITQSSQKTYYLKHNLKTSNTPINNSICVHNMQTAQSSILFDFVKSLYDKVSNKNIKSLSEAIDEFIKQNNSHEALMNSIDEKLKKNFYTKSQTT